jgi:drug/metabolite transporter (DMT)-like permease
VLDELDLAEETVVLGERALSILRPRDGETLLDEQAFATRDEYLPYWVELWPSGLALARAIHGRSLRGARVLELGCGLALPSIAAALAASFSYGLIATYIKGWARDVPSRGLAVGTQLAAGILLVPFLPLWPPAGTPTPLVIGCMLALGLVCGAVAYVLYFRLIADIGATGALTVTYLIPVFGLLWGALFLGEAITVLTLAGAALVILGTVLVLTK